MKSIITTFKSIKGKNCLLSSSLHKQIDVVNKNHLPLRSLLARELNRNDLGKESVRSTMSADQTSSLQRRRLFKHTASFLS